MAKKIKRELECILSQEEINALGVKSSETKHKARMLKEEATALEKEAKAMDEQVASKKIKREVECVEVKNFAGNEIRIERVDERRFWPEDSPVVETRAMTGDERQLEIDGAADSGGGKVTTSKPKGRGKKNAPN